MSAWESVTDRPARFGSGALIVAAVIACPFALGGTSPVVIGSLAIAALLAALLAMIDARSSHHGLPWGLGGWVILAMAAVVALQCAPIPPSVLARLAPATKELFEFTLGPRHLFPAWRPLSLDPPATRLEWVKLVAYVALYAAGAHLARSRGGRRTLMYAVAGLGGALTLCAALHAIFELHTVFGVEVWTRDGLVTPFVDRNHVASVLDLSMLVQLGLAFRTDDRRKTFAWGALAIATGATALLANSRAGALSLAAGTAVFMAFLGRRAEGDRRVRSIRAALAATLGVGALGIAVYLNSEVLLARWASLFDEHTVINSVVSLWPTVVPMVKAHWLAGVGRGAFLVAFPPYQVNFADYTVTHPENVLLQLTSEFGLPLGLGFLVLLAGSWVTGVRRSDLSAAEAGLAAGLFAVGLHEFADFGLELTGVAVPALIAFTALEIRPEASSRVGLRPALAGWLVLLLGLGVVAIHPPRLLQRDRDELDAVAKKGPPEAVEEAAWKMVERHPIDYVIQLTPAFADVRAKPPQPGRALRWANRAMYLAPLSPWPHRVAAEALLELGKRSQAMLEFRLAFNGLERDQGFLADLHRLLHTPQEFADAVRQDASGFSVAMDLLANQPAIEKAVGEIALTRLALEEPAVLHRLAWAAAQSGDHARSLEVARRALASSETQPDGFIEVSNEQLALQDATAAESTLKEGLAHLPGNTALTIALAQLLAGHDRAAEAHDLLAHIAVHDLRERLQVLDVDAVMWERQGLAARGLADLRQASQLSPRDPARRFAIARMLESQGRLREALLTLNEGLSLQQGDDRTATMEWRTKLTAAIDAQERDRLMRESEAPPDRDPER